MNWERAASPAASSTRAGGCAACAVGRACDGGRQPCSFTPCLRPAGRPRPRAGRAAGCASLRAQRSRPLAVERWRDPGARRATAASSSMRSCLTTRLRGIDSVDRHLTHEEARRRVLAPASRQLCEADAGAGLAQVLVDVGVGAPAGDLGDLAVGEARDAEREVAAAGVAAARPGARARGAPRCSSSIVTRSAMMASQSFAVVEVLEVRGRGGCG